MKRILMRHGLGLALVFALGYMVLTPLVQLQMLALQDGAHGYAAAVESPNFARTMWTTVALALGSLIISVVLGTWLAWLSTQLPARAEWMAMLPVLPIVLPPVAGVIGWAMLLAPRSGIINRAIRALPFYPEGDGLPNGPIDVFTPTWIIILTGLSLTSFVYVFLRAGLLRLNFELIEAARNAGATPLRAFLGIVLPLIRPSLIYGTAVALLLGLGQFTAPLLLGTVQNVRVLTTDVYRFTSSPPIDYGAAAALASPLLLFGFVIVLIQRMLLSNQQRFVSDVGKGTRSIGRASSTSVVGILIYSLLSTVLPILALLVVSLAPFWTGTIRPETWTLDNYRTVLAAPGTLSAIRTSLIVSTVSVLISIPIGYLVAEVLHRRRASPAVRSILDLIVSLPLGVPAVVFGAGFLFTYTKPPLILYGTYWVLIIVYVTLMLPFTTRMQLAARLSLGNSFEEASRISGASALRTHLSILVPMMRGAIAGASALMFVLLSHEFAGSLLVRSTQTQVMGTIFYDYWINTSYPLVASMGLIMCLVTAAGVAVAFRVGGRANTLERL